MAKQRVTLKFLAERTGFDKSTISRVLRGDKTLSIRPENASLILRVAKEFNYVPNPTGQRLRSARTFSLGAVIPSLQNNIHAQIVEGAYDVCNSEGYSLILAQATAEESQMDVIRNMISNSHIEGLLIFSFQSKISEYESLKTLGIPFAAVNWKADGLDNSITFEEYTGSFMAVKHLIELGHRNIAHLSGDLNRFNASERFRGYKAALQSAGLEFDPDLVDTAGYSFREGYDGMTSLLKRRRGSFTAVFAVSLLTAAGAIAALRTQGVSTPGEISVMGFHDGLIAQVISPPMSTVAFPLKKLGQEAASGMIEILDGKRRSFEVVLGGGTVIKRESTRAIG